GRAARNAESRVILYADTVTGSMKTAMDETERRRTIQGYYNAQHGITPKTIVKPIANSIEITSKVTKVSYDDIPDQIDKLKALMAVASSSLDFETAIKLRDNIQELKALQNKMKKDKRNG
ncbi:MAG: excinuclease ABC subunit B, partial [Clostridiales bacterium]|nr:excinuclease ABC subunit B [Clostridiales bacterium]